MTEGEFPFRSFTMRSEGYDRNEVDSYVEELQGEIVEQRRALEAATHSGSGSDTRLHDPEGAVTRTLAIAQETADRVLHDSQVEADRRRTEADEHASNVIADADERAARLLGDMESQAAEVREQGVAAARSAIQVERDKAMAELAHVRRVRDDLRNEAVDLKASLDSYRSQAREASDTLAAAAAGPLMSLDLPDFIDDDVVLAGISAGTANVADDNADNADNADIDDYEATDLDETTDETDGGHDGSHLRAVEDEPDDDTGDDLADVISIDADYTDDTADDDSADNDPVDDDSNDPDEADEHGAADDGDADDDGDDDGDGGFGGTFLAEVRAAAEDDDVALAPENDDSDRFLSELRGIADNDGDDLDSDAADTFFDDEG